jgi:hypothetical protein
VEWTATFGCVDHIYDTMYNGCRSVVTQQQPTAQMHGIKIEPYCT